MRFTIGRQLAIGFSSVVAVVGVIGAMALQGVGSGAALTERLAGSDNEKHTLALTWERNVAVNGARTYSLLKADDKVFIDDTRRRIDETSKEITRVQMRLTELLVNDEGKAVLDEISARRERYVKASKALFEKQAASGTVPSEDLAVLTNALDGYVGAVQQLVARQSMLFDAAATEARTTAARHRMAMIAGMLVAAGLISVVGLVLTRRLSRRIGEARRVVGEVAEGRLDTRVQAEGSDEVADLMLTLETMTANLRNLIVTIGGAAGGIRTASSEIAAGSLDLSGRTEAAASNLQQTSASMEQLTQTVRANADSASQANQLARSASEVAARGGDVVGQVVSTMEGITESSRRIAEIIGVIDSIAFQTNILALNAAVEAARAGEQGRGFAVVAGEVRNLAQRSAEAASQIKGLITNSVGEVETGSRLVQQAGATMEEIVTSVRRVTDIIGEITSATSEQSAQIGQINAAIGTLDEMTQQNAALVEQSSAAADTMTRQAEELAASVARFRVGAHGDLTPTVLAPARPPSGFPPATPARAVPSTPSAASKPRGGSPAEPPVRASATPRRTAAPVTPSAGQTVRVTAAATPPSIAPDGSPGSRAAATAAGSIGPAVTSPPMPIRRSQEPALTRTEPDDDWESF